MKKIKTLKISEDSHELCEVLLSNDNGITELYEIYDVLKVRTIDITERQFGKEYYSIICDDEGLFKEKPIFTLWRNREPQLAGNLLITKYNRLGEQIGLSDSDIITIKQNLREIIYSDIYFKGSHRFKAFEIIDS